MLTTPSWTDPPAVVRRLAHGIRRIARRALPLAESVKRVQIVVFRSASSPASPALSEATMAAIELNRGPAVTVEVTTQRPPIDVVDVDPGILWLFLLDGAELAPYALSRLVEIFDADPDLDMAYGDAAARLDSDSDTAMAGPWLLPGFSPDRLADQFYLGHAVAFRPHRLVPVGAGPIEGPWSLAASARTVAHLPEPLYRPAPGVGLWKSDQVDRIDQQPRAAVAGTDLPPVSIVIPTNGSIRDLQRGPTRLVDQAVQSVLSSRYPRIEIVVVLTPGSPHELESALRDIVHQATEATLTVVTDDRPFNFSNACNRGAVASTGEVLVFLNDDTEVCSKDWLVRLIDHAVKADVGAVGARLLYDDGRVQHSGIWSRGGHPTHRYEGFPGDADGYLGALRVTQNCLAVTGACLAVERSKFDLVGGFSPVFPNSYNDVDLCLKLLDRGYRTVVEPRAELYHYEASSRDPSITDDDLAALHDRWRWRLNHDPFDNPHHTAERSEEWPPPINGPPNRTDDRGVPRRWPLDPVGRLRPS